MNLHRVIAQLQRLATTTPASADARFRELASDIWGKATYDAHLTQRIHMSTEPPTGGVLASVTSNGTQRVRGFTLVSAAPSYTLRLAPRFYELPSDRADGILKHEALHIGYPKHDRNFNAHARSINAPLTENESEGGTVKVQVKDGARFKTVREFATEDEASAWVRSILRDSAHELHGKHLRMML